MNVNVKYQLSTVGQKAALIAGRPAAHLEGRALTQGRETLRKTETMGILISDFSISWWA